MIEKLEKLDSSETIIARVIITKVDKEYISYLDLEIPENAEASHLIHMLRELSEAFNDCRFKLDRIIDGI